MATQSLYRRYRPRRFSELKGQDHVVRALRNAVLNHREGQAYLFSGPRGTGKTSSARILAKVLNCEASVDGEPCCECESCLAVEAGTSYDVFELDAASNRGIDDIRNVIDKASLGTPGRHKVYILDEVHMLTAPANAALLKTLEEPPPHVVFVLATTDPQKVPETIRSRTQHLQFHLLPMEELEAHVRWVASDAGIDIDESALQVVLNQGAGSARDTLSALELVAVSGGTVEEAPRLGDVLDALADQDTGLALATVAHAVQVGRQARTLAEDIVRELREAFLTMMAPELVQVPAARAEALADQARRVGAPLLVRAMEVIGEVLVEMRHAPDPRLLLEVSLVKLTNAEVDPGVASLLTRLKHLEDLVAQGGVAAERPPAVDPTTGRAKVGSRARADVTSPTARPAPAPAAASSAPRTEAPSEPAAQPPPAAEPAPAAPDAPRHGSVERAIAAWQSDVLPSLKPMVRALYSAGELQGEHDGRLQVSMPNVHHRRRAEEHVAEVERALATVAGGPVRLVLVEADHTGGQPRPGRGSGGTSGATSAPPRGTDHRAPSAPGREPPPEAPSPAPSVDAAHDEEDLSVLEELSDAPPVNVETPIDRLAKAFPGSQLIDEQD